MENESRRTSSFPSASHSGSGDPGKKDDKDLERRRILYSGLKLSLRNEIWSHAEGLFPNKLHETRFRALFHERFPNNGTDWEKLAKFIYELNKMHSTQVKREGASNH